MWGLREISHTSEDKTFETSGAAGADAPENAFGVDFAPYFSEEGAEDWSSVMEGVLDYAQRRRQARTKAEVLSLFGRKTLLEARLMRAESRATELHNYATLVVQSASLLNTQGKMYDRRHRENVHRYGQAVVGLDMLISTWTCSAEAGTVPQRRSQDSALSW